MHQVALGERERLPNEAPQSLAQDVVEALNVTRLAVAFARGFVLFIRKYLLVSLPKVAVQQAPLVPLRDALPEQAACFFAATADGIGHDLASAPTLSRPNPAFVLAPLYKRPHFVQHISSSSSTSERLAFASVVFKSGRFTAFFKPSDQYLAAEAEDAAHAAQRCAFMIGGQHLGLKVLAVTTGLRVLGLPFLQALQKYFCLPLGALPSRRRRSLPQWTHKIVSETMT